MSNSKDFGRHLMKASEGARLLTESGDSLREIAERIGVTREMARQWRTGGKLPSAENRSALQKAYGIPPKAWDQVPRTAAKKKASSNAAKPVQGAPAKVAKRSKPATEPAVNGPAIPVVTSVDTSVDTVDAEQRLREQLARLDEMRRDSEITSAALVQVERIETQVLRELGRITGEISAISEETIVRHPAFKRVMDAVLEALDKHPGALADVEAALAGLDG